jgi:hypothetical protein
MPEGNRIVKKGLSESPVPEALGRLLALLAKRLGAESMDRIWIFPPLVKGRKEWGLVAVSCMAGDPAQRSLITARYAAELTGNGMAFEPEFLSEGIAPPDRLPQIMDGVVRRSDLQLGMPREARIGGDPDKFRDLLLEYGWEDPPNHPVTI